MPASVVSGLTGPTKTGWSFGMWLHALLGVRDLEEAVVASAFLTVEGAEHLISSLAGRERKTKKPRVTVVVGTMEQFTRRKAIQRLLPFCVGGGRAASFPVRLELLCPRDAGFHVKATYVRRKAGPRAVVGSHNLTQQGLDSHGELGVALKGKPASAVKKALQHWIGDSDPWARVIGTYKESKKWPSNGSWRVKKHGGAGRSFSDVAVCHEADEELSRKEIAVFNAAVAQLRKESPDTARRADRFLWHGRPRAEAVETFNYYRGAVLGYSDDYPGEEWRIGQRRSILRVLDARAVMNDQATLVATETLKSFTVDEGSKKVAKKLGLVDDEYSGEQLALFLRFLKTGKLESPRA